MQKRPAELHHVRSPIDLPADFPVNCYRFDHPDRPIRCLHVHDCLEIGYCHHGSGLFVVEEKLFAFAAGDVCLISGHKPHFAQSTPGTTSQWSFILVDVPRLLQPAPVPAHHHHHHHQKLGSIIRSGGRSDIPLLVRELIAELEQCQRDYRQAVRGLLQAVLIRAGRLMGKPANSEVVASAAAGRDRITPAIQRIANGYAQELSLPELAECCAMPQRTFRRVFHQAVGYSPMHYLARFRVHMATTLLQTDGGKRITEVALETGFESLSSFNRHFRAITGMSPRQWRTSKERA